MIIVAKALIFNDKNQILVLKRSETHPMFPLHYDLPGGIGQDGENAAQVAAREIFEETGLVIEPENLEIVRERVVTERDTTQFVLKTTINEFSPKITISWEHAMYIWLSPKEILSLPAPERPDSFYMLALNYIKAIA
jgi:8-oxo-dGTP pyrophosphatase MutT (NUDIX family)